MQRYTLPCPKAGNDIKYIAWKNYISKAFGNEEEATPALYKKHSLLYYTTVLLVAILVISVRWVHQPAGLEQPKMAGSN
jgi:hypothetical protein